MPQELSCLSLRSRRSRRLCDLCVESGLVFPLGSFLPPLFRHGVKTAAIAVALDVPVDPGHTTGTDGLAQLKQQRLDGRFVFHAHRLNAAGQQLAPAPVWCALVRHGSAVYGLWMPY